MVTIKDVAERAGVSTSTVSYVLSGARKISAGTREVVRQAIDELGYHPHASARALRAARTRVLALALPQTTRSYRAVDGRFIHDLSVAAVRQGHDLLLMTAQEGVPGLRRIARGRLADAGILMAVDLDDPRIAAMREANFPISVVGRPTATLGTPWTDLDFEQAAVLALADLASAGHHRLAYLAVTEQEIQARRSYAAHGLAGARRAAGQLAGSVEIVHSTSDRLELRRRLAALFAMPDAPTALAVQDAAAARVVVEALAEQGMSVPSDVSVVVIGTLPDDPEHAAFRRVELPVERMAEHATALAIAAVDDPTSGTRVLIPPELLPGPSVAPPREGR
ncbi:LacI family DNA-binding transcriptional regulator [Actinoalloteichus spitiensis]|uniref:LacI family DNA-binding transcriptional regulator n=1 Tax=Actinoalloteichus spitiensis TaxID=252394 RepID=UPI00036AE260|nr:LacI family DNA-binding transcriptional regulator [Actinoalloteichus spitiensis]